MCPSCGDLNFNRNNNCRKCNIPRPPDAEDRLGEDQLGEKLDVTQMQQMQQLQQLRLMQMQLALDKQQQSPSFATRLHKTVRVANVPSSMAVDSLHMILTGMFGPVAASSIGVEGATGQHFALVEFKEYPAAAKALQAKSVKFGVASLEFSASSVEIAARGATRDRSRSRGKSG